jgi:hypothetical protein
LVEKPTGVEPASGGQAPGDTGEKVYSSYVIMQPPVPMYYLAALPAERYFKRVIYIAVPFPPAQSIREFSISGNA